TPIRLTGQDVVRGTFSQRHLSFHDPETGAVVTPLAQLPNATAACDARNSPLSENACVGFEYGSSVQAPDALALSEARDGDCVVALQSRAPPSWWPACYDRSSMTRWSARPRRCAA